MNDGNADVCLFAVFAEFGEDGVEERWVTEGVAAQDCSFVFYDEGDGRCARPVDEERVVAVKDTAMLYTTVLFDKRQQHFYGFDVVKRDGSMATVAGFAPWLALWTRSKGSTAEVRGGRCLARLVSFGNLYGHMPLLDDCCHGTCRRFRCFRARHGTCLAKALRESALILAFAVEHAYGWCCFHRR